MGKSAQFPLHVWLPDAMEGPTPVSALIHAATMVNAGVYLVARANDLFASATEAMVVVAAIGIFTAILAASIAMTQTDIKRVLAYSTLSQLGYMFAALGVGAFTAAIFHLMTHGFFKGLLFLGSGSVIHAVHEEQDMRKMGGLSQKIKITYITMLIGSLAIAGIPPLAGFFSKDEILGEALQARLHLGLDHRLHRRRHDRVLHVPAHGHDVLGRVPRPEGDLGQGPRVARGDDDPAHPAGDPVGLPRACSSACRSATARISRLARAGLRRGAGDPRPPRGRRTSSSASTASLILMSVGDRHPRASSRPGGCSACRSARSGCRPDPERVQALSARVPFLYRASLNKWWFDELNHLLFIVIGGKVAAALWWFDREIVDGTVNAVGRDTDRLGPRAPPDPDRPRPELRARHRHRAHRHGRRRTCGWWPE